MEKDIIVKLENVHKIYKQGEIEFPALRGINLFIRRGDFLVIMGPSGSGKSTLLNMIGLLDRPTMGKIYIDGIDTAKISDRELAKIRNYKIGFIFQQYNLIQRLNVYENIELPLLVRNMDKEIRRKKVMEALKKANGDPSWLQKRPNQLSGGQQQRVAIARALVTDPSLILADEPTGNLDRDSAKAIISTLVQLNDSGQTIVLVTHDPEVANCGKKVLTIRNGIIIGEREPKRSDCFLYNNV